MKKYKKLTSFILNHELNKKIHLNKSWPNS